MPLKELLDGVERARRDAQLRYVVIHGAVCSYCIGRAERLDGSYLQTFALELKEQLAETLAAFVTSILTQPRRPEGKVLRKKSARQNKFIRRKVNDQKETQRALMNEYKKRNPAKLFWVVILLIILYAVLDVIAQSLPPHYSPISQAESDLAVGKFGFIMTLNFLNRGVLSLVFIFAFLRTLDLNGIARSHLRTGTYLLGAWAIGAILLAIFPTDVPATPVSWHGAIHIVVALIAFIGGAFGAFAISWKLGKNHEFEGLKPNALPLSVIAVILLVIEFGLDFVFPHLDARIGGLTERVFLGSVLLWIGIVSAYLATHVCQTKVTPNLTSE